MKDRGNFKKRLKNCIINYYGIKLVQNLQKI